MESKLKVHWYYKLEGNIYLKNNEISTRIHCIPDNIF